MGIQLGLGPWLRRTWSNHSKKYSSKDSASTGGNDIKGACRNGDNGLAAVGGLALL